MAHWRAVQCRPREGDRDLRCPLMAAWDSIGVNDILVAWHDYSFRLRGRGPRLWWDDGVDV